MLITVFPDRLQVDDRLNPSCPLGHMSMSEWPNVLLYYKTRKNYAQRYVSPLSIKTAFSGCEHYTFHNFRVAVTGNSYLVVNRLRDYCYEITAERLTESLCVFFQDGFAEEVLRALTQPTDKLLAEPVADTGQPVCFFEHLYPGGRTIGPILNSLRQRIVDRVECYGFYEECFHALLEGLLSVHRALPAQIDALPSVRFATRVELYKRLHQARDFIDASYNNKLNLSEMAGVARLSRHHFLRTFKAAFGTTPHQYLTRRRLQEARWRLIQSNLSMTQICYEVGFENHSSFSRLFKQAYHCSPSQYRIATTPRFF